MDLPIVLYVVAILSLLLSHVILTRDLKILFLPFSFLDTFSACFANFSELSRTIPRIFGFGTVGIDTPRKLMSKWTSCKKGKGRFGSGEFQILTFHGVDKMGSALFGWFSSGYH